MKRLLISIFGVITVVIVGFICVIAVLVWMNSQTNWGHHFSFENELGVPIDSIRVKIGDRENIIYPFEYEEGVRSFAENLDVPESGYPHEVSLIIYSVEGELVLEADSFNCYNCDGSHEYILKKSGAEYRFSH